MRLLRILVIFPFILFAGGENHGQYEISLTTNEVDNQKVFIKIATYDELKSNFSSDQIFKDFLFNLYGYQNRDSLTFYQRFYQLNHLLNENEKLLAINPKDYFTVAKTDIKAIQFKSFDPLFDTYFAHPLSLKEIQLLQEKSNVKTRYHIDPHQEDYAELWLLSYNENLAATDINNLITEARNDYEKITVNCNPTERSWIYIDWIKEWKTVLNQQAIYLVTVTKP